MSNDNGKVFRAFLLAKLKHVYDNYGVLVYTLCYRLLADKQAAESATVDVFVEFSREMMNSLNESEISSRLKELAKITSLSRLRKQRGILGYSRGNHGRFT
jgi:RNA polymerase sigma-70 factor (ECF subfamily)